MGNNHLPTERDERSTDDLVSEGFEPLSRLEFFLRYKNGTDASGVDYSKSSSDKERNDGWSHRSEMQSIKADSPRSVSAEVNPDHETPSGGGEDPEYRSERYAEYNDNDENTLTWDC